ncbi:hypothetical protein L7F22_048680 [Adiantum nelumboides]|nr:hypothetical protein [Adiantum nelumboides]
MPTMSASKLLPHEVVEKMYIQLVEGRAEGINDKEDEVQKMLLHEKRDLWLRNEGLFSTYSGFYIELEQLNKDLEVLKNSPNPDGQEVDCNAVEVKAITKMLTQAGGNIDLAQLKTNLDSLEVHKKSFKVLQGLKKVLQSPIIERPESEKTLHLDSFQKVCDSAETQERRSAPVQRAPRPQGSRYSGLGSRLVPTCQASSPPPPLHRCQCPVPSFHLVQVLHYTVNMLKAADLLKVSSYDLDLRIHHPCRSTNFGWIPPRCAMLQAPPLPMRSLELKNSTPVADIRKLRLITAIKTPYLPDGRFDLEAYDKLVHSQIENGVEGVIVGGTTGEGQLMGWDEHIMLIGHTVNCFGGVIKVIGNTGSNSTGEAMHATEQGFAVGMHAALHINPYYGKTSQEGLLLHFQSVLSMGPSVIYNVPTRTGQDIPPSVIVKLMDIPNFAGVKECVGNDRIKGYTERNIAVWSGNDDQCHDARWDFGARGVISVVSNLIPGLMRDLIIKGKDKGLNEKLLPLINWLFVEPNPIGLNTALVQLGIVRPVFRLPYVPLDIKKRQEFVELVNSIGREHFVGDRDVQLLSDEDFLVLPRY